MIVGFDIESYYDNEYSLSKMPVHAYIRDDRWRCLGCGFQFGDEAPFYVEDPEPVLRKIDAYGWERVTLVAHNASFDGSVLWERFGKRRPGMWLDTSLIARWMIAMGKLPPEQGASLAKLAPLVGMQKGNTWDAVHGGGQGLADYGTEDVRIMMALLRLFMKHEPPADELMYMDMHIRMQTEPQLITDPELLEEAALITPEQERLGKILRKDANMVRLLEAHGIDVEYKTTPKGKRKPALAKTDRFMQELLAHPNPDVAELASLRKDAGSNLTRTRALTLQRVGNPLPFPVLYYGAHCVPGDTEVLTLDGWRRIDEWDGGEIAQVTEEQEIRFLPATRYRGPMVTDWIESHARYMPCAFTPGHRVPHFGVRGTVWQESPAEEACSRSQLRVPVAGTYSGMGAIKPEQARVLAMIQADGSFCEDASQGRLLAVFLKKPRKIERARELLAAAGVRFRELSFASHPGYVRFVVAHRDYPTWLGPHRKVFGPWVLESTPEAREALVTEAIKWDGHVHSSGQWTYSSSDARNADWFSTLCHLTGRAASTYRKPATGNRKPNYVVTVRQRNYATVQRRQWKYITRPMRSYCPETATGYWLARANGHIFVTGNTGRGSGEGGYNMQNMPAGGILRRAISAPNGGKLVVGDSGQIEARTVGWRAGDERLLEVFRQSDADPNPARDAYRRFGGQYMYHLKPEDLTNEQRQISKAGLLGLGFGQGWRGLINSARSKAGLIIPEDDARRAVKAYREGFKRVPQWWRRLMRWAREDGYIELPDGRRITYPDLREEDVEDAEGNVSREFVFDRPVIFSKGPRGKRQTVKVWHGLVCENDTQATARSVVFWQALQMRKDGVPVLGMSHDEVISHAASEAEAKDVAECMNYWFRQVPPWAEGLPTRGGVNIGDNYAECK